MNLSTPDAFQADAYGWVTNQLSHALVGLVLVALVSFLLSRSEWIEDKGLFALALVVAGYFIGWEVAWQLVGAGWTDALEDTAFVALGGAVGLFLWRRRGDLLAVVLAFGGLLVWLGVRARK